MTDANGARDNRTRGADELIGMVVTFAELQDRLDAEWVLLADPQTGASNEILSGRVMALSRSRDDIDRSLQASARGRRYAVVFIGDLPDDSAVVL